MIVRLSAAFLPRDHDLRARLDVAFGDERGQRLRQVAVDRALQLARAVLGAGAAFEQELLRRGVHLDLERAAAEARVDVLLQIVDVLLEDRRQRLLVERLVGDDDVDAVDELGGIAAPHRGHADVLELAGELDGVALAAALEAEVRLHLLHHLAGAEVAREEDEALLEVDGGVVAERQRRAIEDAEQQRRQRRRRLLDLVEQHDRDGALG